MRIRRILILVELANGHTHQVLTSAEQKQIGLALLRNESGELLLSKRLEPVTVKTYEEEKGEIAKEAEAGVPGALGEWMRNRCDEATNACADLIKQRRNTHYYTYTSRFR